MSAGGDEQGQCHRRLAVADLVRAVAYWVGPIDDGPVVPGVLFVLPAVYHAVRYRRSRRTVLSVGVAGDDDDLSTADVERPRLALGLPTGEAEEAALEWSASTE